MSDARDTRREVQRRIDFIDMRLSTETDQTKRNSWAQERNALASLLKRSEKVQGLVIALELIAKAAHKGDLDTIKRVADEALGRTS